MFTDYKRARTELKKRSTDTLRLQKKVRKGSKTGDLQRRVESCMQDVNERRFVLEETEKKAVRAALIEERSRFCVFVAFMKPVVVSTVRQSIVKAFVLELKFCELMFLNTVYFFT